MGSYHLHPGRGDVGSDQGAAVKTVKQKTESRATGRVDKLESLDWEEKERKQIQR